MTTLTLTDARGQVVIVQLPMEVATFAAILRALADLGFEFADRGAE